MSPEILFWNRYTNRLEKEAVYGGFWVRLLYQLKPFFLLTHLFLASAWISKLYGFWQNRPASRRKIAPFVKSFQIDMKEFETREFQSFNDFFTRQFQPGARKFAPEGISAPAEARYLGFSNALSIPEIPIKGLLLHPREILGENKFTECFLSGPALIARLCPVDYHRFHYPVDGCTLAQYHLGTRLHSVNPVALRACPSILKINERIVSILNTKNLGLLAYVEVGALCVGKIVQSHPTNAPFKRGDEKGYFLFGASTVLLFGEKGRWDIAEDILKNTQKGLETFVRLGDTVAKSR